MCVRRSRYLNPPLYSSGDGLLIDYKVEVLIELYDMSPSANT
jgi:hypothetical protein